MKGREDRVTKYKGRLEVLSEESDSTRNLARWLLFQIGKKGIDLREVLEGDL